MAAVAVLSLGLFMTLLDLTIVNIAIPSIVDSIHARTSPPPRRSMPGRKQR
jgi:hypothetical protein